MFDNNNDPPQKVDIPEFAKRIRAKYPDAYNDIDDYELTERTIKKHPTYYNAVNVPQEFSLLGGATSGYPEIDKLYVEAATKYNVPADLLLEQGRKETAFDPDVFYGRRNSSAGAQGAGQFMPGTAPLYGVKDRKDPIQSIHGQAKYMRKLLDDFNGDEALALAGYNAGEHRRSLKAGKIPNIPETQDYVKTIQENLAKARSAQIKRLRDFYPSTQQPQQPRLPGPQVPGVPTPTPTFPGSPMAPPVSPAMETPMTLEKQAASAIDGNSPRAAVLLTDPNQVKLIDPNLISNLTPVETPNGLLLVNEAKAKALGVTDYGANMAALIGKVEDVGDATAQGKAVVTLDAQGNELASSIVSDPFTAAMQAHVDRESFPYAADQQIVDAQDVVEKRVADNAQLAPPVQPVVGPDQPEMPAPEASTETPEESYKQYLAYAQAEGQTPMTPEEFAASLKEAEGLTPQAQAVEYETQPVQTALPQTAPGGRTGQAAQPKPDVLNNQMSFPREVGAATGGEDLNRVAGVFEFDPNNKLTNREKFIEAVSQVGAKYGITRAEVERYANNAYSDDSKFFRGGGSENTVNVTLDVLAAIGGEDKVREAVRTEEIQAREAVDGKMPGPVGRDWAKEDAEWLNSNAGNVLMALNPGFAFLEKEQRDELGATLAGGVIGSGARTARALAGIARPINTDVYEYMQSIAEPGESLEAQTGSDSIVSTVGRIAGGAPGDLSRIILFTRLAGLAGLGNAAVVVGMAAEMGTQSSGRGDDPKEILKQTVKGGTLGAVFAAAPIIGRLTGEFPVASLTASPMKQAIGREVATVGAVGLGSGLVEQTFGSTEEQALQTAVVNSLFHLVMRGVKLPARTVRARDAQGNEVNVGVDLNGAVRLLKGRVKKPDAEVFVDTKVGADGVYRAPGDTAPVRPKAVMDRLRAGTPPKELQARNPVRIDAPDPQAVQKAQIDTRVGKIADALTAKGPMTLEQIQKATRFNKNNVLNAIDTLYQARKIEILPDNSVRLIDQVGTKADQELYERYSQPRPPEEGVQPAPLPKPPAPVVPGSGVQVGGTQAPVAPKPETPIDWREPNFQGTEKPDYQEPTTTAQKAREEGRVTIDGTEYVRQQPMVETTPKGKAGRLRFADKEPDVPFEFRLMEAGMLQPAHMQGVPNRQHFIPEAQPNKRTDQASKLASDAIAARPDLEQVAESPIAYAGAPVVNTRGETIQGNNRSEGLKKHYQGGGTLYKQSLAENADRFGFTRDQIEKMQNPVLVRMVDVDDDTAITLGNYRMADLESGGSQNIDPVRLAGRIPYQKKREILDDVFLNAPEDATLTDLIRGNEGLVRTLLDPYLTEGQKQSLVNAEKNLTPNAVKDIEASFRQFLFDKGDVDLPDLFEGLNYNSREAITASIPRIFSTPEESSIIPDLQNAIVVSSRFQQSGVDSWETWVRNPDMIANRPAPIEAYTPLELTMAEAFNKAKTQKEIKDKFTEYAKIVNGSEGNMFEPATEPRSRAEAVREIFGVEDVKPRTTADTAARPAEARPQTESTRRGGETTEETRDDGRETVAPADRRRRESQEYEAREVGAEPQAVQLLPSGWTEAAVPDMWSYRDAQSGSARIQIEKTSDGQFAVRFPGKQTETKFPSLEEAMRWGEDQTPGAKQPSLKTAPVAQKPASTEVAKKEPAVPTAPTVPLPAYYRSIVRRELGRGQTPEEIADAYKLDPGTIAGMREISDQNVGEYGQTSHYIRRMLMREENAPLINKLARVIVPQARIHENNPLFDKMSSLDAILDTIADTNGFLRSSEMDAKAWNDAMMSFADRVPFSAVNVIHEALAHQEEWFRKREALIDELLHSPVMDDIIAKSEQMGQPIVTTFKDTPDIRGKMRATSLRQRILDIGKKYAIEKTSDPQVKQTGLSRKSIEDAFNRALQRAFATRTSFRIDNAGDRTTKPRDGEKGTGTSQEEIPFTRIDAPQAEIDAVEEVRDKQGRLLAPNGKVSNLNELQWKQVRTPSFINWFGDWINDPENASKVVDENGEPLVMKHGSPARGIRTFLPDENGLIFVTRSTKVADAYRNKEADRQWGVYESDRRDTSTGEIYDVYVKAENIAGPDNLTPAVVEAVLANMSRADIQQYAREIKRDQEALVRAGVISAESIKNEDAAFDELIVREFWGNETQWDVFESPEFTQLLKDEGFDGLTIRNKYNTLDAASQFIVSDDLAVFSPTQIKSAIGNRGTFDPNDPNILFAREPLSYTPPYTITALTDEKLAGKRGKDVKLVTIKQILKQPETKQIEREIIAEVLEMPAFQGKQQFSFDEFEAAVKEKLLPLKVIESSSYADYGSDNVGVHIHDAVTNIYNTELQHGEGGHFRGEFWDASKKYKYEIRDVVNPNNGRTVYVTVPKDVDLNESNIAEMVGTATPDRQKAEEWLEIYNKQETLNQGMFGHTRVWTDGTDSYVAEIQSDAFQQKKAEDLVVESYLRKYSEDTLSKSSPVYEKAEDLYNLERKIGELDEASTGRAARNYQDYPTRSAQLNAEVETTKTRLETLEAFASLDIKAFERIRADVMAERGVKSVDWSNVGSIHQAALTKWNDAAKLEQLGLNQEFHAEVAWRGVISNSLDPTTHLKREIEEAKNKVSIAQNNKANFEKYINSDEYRTFYETKKLAEKVRTQLVRALPIEDKQFIAHRKNYTTRLLREEIRRQTVRGQERLLIPTPRTLALIEGYINDEGSMPYEIERAEDSRYLSTGDTIDYGGTIYTVINDSSEEIEVTDADFSYIDEAQYVEEEIDRRMDDVRYELEKLEGDILSESDLDDALRNVVYGVQERIDAEDYFEVNEDGEFTFELTDDLEQAIRDDIAENVGVDIYDTFKNDFGYELVIDLGNGRWMYSEEGGMVETFKQPDEYSEAADVESFDINDFSDTEATVLAKYQELNDLFKRERADAETVTDNNGNEWLATNLDPEPGDVILFTQFSMFAQTDLFGNPVEVAPEQPSMFDMARSQAEAENQLRHELETAYGKRTADYIAGMETSANKQVARVARELADARLLVASKGTNALGIINDAADALDQFAIAQHTKSPIDVILAQGRLDTAVLSDQARDFARAMADGRFAPMFRTALSKVRTDNEAIPMMVASIGTGDSTNAPFYSQLERTIEQKMPNKASASQVRGIIKETKQEEREWLGIDEFLGNRTVTKQEVLDFIAENQVRLEEVVKGEGDPARRQFEFNWTPPKGKTAETVIDGETFSLVNVRTFEDGSGGLAIRNHGVTIAEVATIEEAEDRITDFLNDRRRTGVSTKFSQYTLPGGVPGSYRELLLTMPEKARMTDGWEVLAPDGIGSYGIFDTRADAENKVDSARKFDPESGLQIVHRPKAIKKGGEADYRSSHWSEPNVLAHIRFDDRIIDGKRVMHVSEFQSDLHQEGRKKGYQSRKPLVRDDLKVIFKDDLHGWGVQIPSGFVYTFGSKESAEKNVDGILKDINAGKIRDGVPDFPFKKSWPELSLKRALRWAVENGYDALTWDTGETQNDRYDLSKQLNAVRWKPERNDDIAGSDAKHKEVKRLQAETKRLHDEHRANLEPDITRLYFKGTELGQIDERKQGLHELFTSVSKERMAELGIEEKALERAMHRAKNDFDEIGIYGDFEMRREGMELSPKEKASADRVKAASDAWRDLQKEIEAEWPLAVQIFDKEDDVGRFYVDTAGIVHEHAEPGYFSSIDAGGLYGKHITDVLGKEVGEKILAQRNGDLEGEGLKVESPGMKGFYDKILPSFANKYTKKWGGKVERGEVPVKSNLSSGEWIKYESAKQAVVELDKQIKPLETKLETLYADGRQILANKKGPDFAERYRRNQDARESVQTELADLRRERQAQDAVYREFLKNGADLRKPTEPVHRLTITPAMRDSVMQGQPLFNNSPARLLQKALADAEGNDVRKAFRNFRNLGMPSLAQNAKPAIDGATGTFIADIPTTIIFNEAVKRGTGQSVSFLGMYLHPTNVQRVRHGLMDIRREIFRSGNVPAAAAMDKVIGKFDEAADEDYGDVVFAFQDKRFPMTSQYSTQEELGHRGDERLKREVGGQIEDPTPFIGADGYETARKTLSNRYPERMLHREVLGKLQRDDAARELGISEEQAESLRMIRDDQLAGLNVTGQDYTAAYANISKANDRRIKDYANRTTEEVSPSLRPQERESEASTDDGPLFRGGREARTRGDSGRQAATTQTRPRPELERLRQTELRTASREGTQETALTRAEERYIDIKTRKNPAIGETVKNEILFAKQVNNDAWGVKGIILDVVSMPKSFKASLDTALGRQGWLLSLKHPIIGARAFRKQFTVIHPTRGLANYEAFKRDLNLHPFIELAEETGLFLASIADESNITEREESFMSRLLADDPYFKNMSAEKIRNLVTTHIRLSERVFKVLLDDIRINVFSKLAQQMHRWNVKNGRPDDIEQYKAITRFINYASGRGDLGSFNSAAPYFNGVFFSARWMMSRLQVMNPFFYAAMPPGARGLLFRELAGAIGAIGAIALLLKWAGAEVEYDNPDDPNMLRIGFGNYKYQIDAGLMKHLRYAYRMTTATQESDSTRRMTYLTERYIRGSLAPVPGGIWSSLEGKNFIGEPTSYREEALEMFAPITIDSFKEAIELDGTVGAVMMTPEILALGTSRYRTADEVRAEMQKEQAKMKDAKTPAERKEVQRRVKAWNTLLKRAIKYDKLDRQKAAENK